MLAKFPPSNLQYSVASAKFKLDTLFLWENMYSKSPLEIHDRTKIRKTFIAKNTNNHNQNKSTYLEATLNINKQLLELFKLWT